MTKTQKISIVSLIIFLGFMFSLIISFLKGKVFNLDYPFNTFLPPVENIFSDFTEMMPLLSGVNPYEEHNYWLNYFPFMYLLLMPFALIANVNFSFCFFFGIFLILYFWLNVKNLWLKDELKSVNYRNIFIISFCSYPFLILFNRGNTDMLLFLFFVLFIFLYKILYVDKNENNFIQRNYDVLNFICLLLISFLCAAKPYFLVFLLLFLKEKRYFTFFLCGFLALFLNFLAFLVFKGGFLHQVIVFIQNIKAVKYFYVEDYSNFGMGFSSSLWLMLKGYFVYLWKIISLPSLIKIYKIISLFITSFFLYIFFKEKFFWKQIMLISLYVYLLPFMVYDYKLLFFMVPFWLFVNLKEKTKTDFFYVLFFGLLFISKNYFITDLGDGMNFIGSNMLINPILMLVCFVMIFIEQKTEEERV